MEMSSLTRNPDKVLKAIKEDGDTWVATEDVKIYFPSHYINGKIGSLDDKFNVLAFFMFVVGDNYAVYMVPSIMPLTPDSSTTVKSGGEDFYELLFEAGSVITPNLNLVQRKTLAFEIYDEFIAKGRVPVYFDRIDFSRILTYIGEYCGVDLGADMAILSGYGAQINRAPDDLTIPMRERFEKQGDLLEMAGEWIPLRSVSFGADNTTSRTIGSYAPEGFAAALTNPSERVESIEQLLTS